MAQKKLFVLLGGLTHQDLKKFNSYMLSKIETVQNRELLAWKSLYQVGQKKRNLSADDWENISDKLPQVDRRVHSELTKFLQNFLVYQEFRANKDLQNLLLMMVMNKSEYDRYLQGIYKKAIQNPGLKDSRSLLLNHAIHEEMAFYYNRNPERQTPNGLSDIPQNFDSYFFSQKLKYALALINEKKILAGADHSAELPLVHEIVRHLDQCQAEGNENRYDPLVWMFLQVYHLLLSPVEIADKALDRLLSLLEEHQAGYDPDEVRDLYLHALNYTMRQINRYTSMRHLTIMGEIFEATLAIGLLTDENGQLSSTMFKAIVGAWGQLKKIDAVEQFIATYSDSISGDDSENAKIYGQGVLAYLNKNFPTALEHFKLVIGNHHDIFLGLDARVYEARCYFESRNQDPDYFTSLEQNLRAFRGAILRREEKLSEDHRANYREFIQTTFQLSRIADHPGRTERIKKMEDLREALLKQRNVAGKFWLLEMLQEMEAEAQG